MKGDLLLAPSRSEPRTLAAEPNRKSRHCSFCFKSQYEVKTLISRPSAMFSCGECAGAVNDDLAGRISTAKFSSGGGLPERFDATDDTVQGNSSQLQSFVEKLRSRKVSWTEIGTALGVSRPYARERFT
jgi:hypothetical protein